MIPASTVNAKNYHLLGNRITGESRASRMKRVNAHTPYTPSLIDRNPPKGHKLIPTKPLNLGTSPAGELETRVVHTSKGADSAFGLTVLFNSMNTGERKGAVEGTMFATGLGLAAGVGSGYFLNNERVGLLRAGPKSTNSMTDNYALAALSLVVPMLLAAGGHGAKNRTAKQKSTDYKRALQLGAPGVVTAFISNANYTVPIYLTSLVGAFAARRYYKI